MKRILTLLFAISAIVFIACKKDSIEDVLEVNTTKLTFESTPDSKSITLRSSQMWTAQVESSTTNDWCTITPNKGQAGDNLIVVKVSNNTTREERSAIVVIKTESQQKTVTITQKQQNVITVYPSNFKIGHQGGEIQVEVGHNVEYDVEIADAWISKTKTRAFTTEKLSFSIQANETDEDREGTIKFISKDKAITQTITILQEYDSSKPRHNEIWYTTTDNKIVTPDTRYGFGANIVSNTYQNGKGVITFDSDVKQIGINTFNKCNTLVSIVLPNSVTEIGNYAFSMALNGGNLTSVTLPDSVTKIGAYAFYLSSKLSNINLPKNLITIDQNAFRNCTALTSITIPDKVEEIGVAAFRGCNLKEFNGKFASADHRCLIIDGTLVAFADADINSYTTPDNVTAIGGLAFASCSLKKIAISNGVEIIGSEAFDDCINMTDIAIPNSVTSIESGAFHSCQNITSIKLPNDITIIQESTFSNCYNLSEINIPENVTEIKKSAFNGCNTLTEITIPQKVNTIGENAFLGCDNLRKIYCKPTTPPSIERYTFDHDIDNRKIYVPSNAVNAYKTANVWAIFDDEITGYNF